METITKPDLNHQHHWILEEAHGDCSVGVCKYCHAHRDFRNWLPAPDFVSREEASWRPVREYSLK